MDGVNGSERVADKEEERVGRVAPVDRLVMTGVAVLSRPGFPCKILRGVSRSLIADEKRFALAVCAVLGQVVQIGRIVILGVLARQTVVEALQRVAHTDDLIDRIVINPRHPDYHAERV